MSNNNRALFGAGCFWGVQSSFDKVKGVVSTQVGYSGGEKTNPTYEEVCTDRTGHAEVILIDFDPKLVTYDKLVEILFRIHDPTTKNRQGWDIGKQYRSTIMYFDDEQKRIALKVIKDLEKKKIFKKPIVTEVVPAGPFFRAEEYHQKYHEKHGISGCPI